MLLCFDAAYAACTDENGEILFPLGVATVPSAQELYDNGVIAAVNTSQNNTIYDLDAYVAGEEWSVYFPESNKIISGVAVCGPSGKSSTVAGKGSSAYISTSYPANPPVAYLGCFCKLGGINENTNYASAGKLGGSGSTAEDKLNNCRANCPNVCANYIATDAAFRAAIYGGADNCPVGTPGEEPETCDKVATDYCDINSSCEYVLNSSYSVGYTMESGDDYCVATPNEYNILLSTDGSNVLDDVISVYYGTAISGLPIPTLDGYSFQGWFDDNGNEYANGTIYNIADDMILTAQWGRDCDFPIGNAIAQTPSADTVLNIPSVSTLASRNSSVITYSGGVYKVSEEGMSIYNSDQRFSVEYENGLLWGTAFCGPNGSGDKTKLYYTNGNNGLTAYQAGKGCWCRYGKEDAYITDFPWERAATMDDTDSCRATCPSVCANYTATDSKFRSILLNEDAESGTCPVMDTTVQCENKTGYDAAYNLATGECEYTAHTYTINLDFGSGKTTIDIIYDSDNIRVEPPQKTNYMFAGYFTGTNGTGRMVFNEYGAFVDDMSNIPEYGTLYAHWSEDFCTDDNGMVVWNGIDKIALTSELLANGTVAKKDSSVDNEYIINDFEKYTSDTRWSVYFEDYGYVTGSALCGPRNKASYGNVVTDVVTGNTGATVSQAYSGCWCRYGNPVPDAQWVAVKDYYNSGDDWTTRTNACRIDCANACANAIASDATFRTSLYGGNNCPLGSDEPIYCIAGQYMNNGVCTPCPDGYTTDGPGTTSESQCYTTCEQQCTQQTCPDNATCTHGTTTTTGKQYVGSTCDASASQCELNITCDTGYELKDGACTAIVCEPGYYLNGNECIICPLGSYCANNIKTACDTGYTTDNTGATSESQCYTTCEVACTQQTCPDNATCTHGTTTTTGKQYVGSTCDATASQCELNITCDTGYSKKEGEISVVEKTPLIPVDYHEYGDDYGCISADGYIKLGETEYGLTENNTWASHFDYGTVYGRASCQPSMDEEFAYINNNLSGVMGGDMTIEAFESGLAAISGTAKAKYVSNLITELQNGTKSESDLMPALWPVFGTETDANYSTTDTGQYCYCQMTGYAPTDGTKQSVVGAPWVFYGGVGSAGDCADFCALDCAYYLLSGDAFYDVIRAAVFSSLGVQSNVMCEIDTIDIPAGYYLPANTTEPVQCPMNNYCPGQTGAIFNITETQGLKPCPDGTISNVGASGIEQCTGPKSLHIGDDIQMNLIKVKPSTPRVMVFDVLGDLYYGGLSETAKPINKNTDKQFRIYDPESNQNYWMHDYTVQ